MNKSFFVLLTFALTVSLVSAEIVYGFTDPVVVAESFSVTSKSRPDIRIEPLALDFNCISSGPSASGIGSPFDIEDDSESGIYASNNNDPNIQEPSFYYSYFKEKRLLPVEIDAFAILRSGQFSEEAFLKNASKHGLAIERTFAGAKSKWFFAQQKRASRSVDEHKENIRKIANEQTTGFVSPVFRGRKGESIIITPTLLVKFQDDLSEEDAESILQGFDTGVIASRNWGNMKRAYRIESDLKNGCDVLDIANALAELPEVVFAEPDMMFSGKGAYIPNDSGFGNCWGIHNTGQSGGTVDMDMDGPEAWDITTGDASIIVVVLDTGVQQDHPDITQISGADFTSDGPGDGGPVNQYDNHGTPVAGCISATMDNALGTVGISPHCRVASARTFITINSNGSWSSYASWTVDALSWAESIGAKVTNNSNGYGFTSSSIATKYSQTRNNGMVHFASAGNDSSSSIDYPANLFTVNAVAAIDRDGSLSSFSNYGIGLAFSAPGRDVYTTDRTGTDGWTNNDYTYAWGTSVASPYTAGVAALIFSVDSGLSAMEVEQKLWESSTDLGVAGYDTTYGWGLVNAYQAVLEEEPPIIFTIYNDGGATLTVSSIIAETVAPWLDWTPKPPFTVEPSENIVVTVTVDCSLALCSDTVTRLLVYSNDWDENPYPDGVDISVTKLELTGDLDRNCIVETDDLMIFMQDWLYQGCDTDADMFVDCKVGFKDFAVFSEYWLISTE